MDTQRQFDTTAEIVKKMRTEAVGLAEVTIKWPGDDLWIKRAKARKVLTRLLGRGKQEAEVEPGDSDLDLYQAARSDGSPDLTAAEATRVLGLLAYVHILDIDLGATEATVRLEVMDEIEVTHRLKIPTAQQVKECSKAMDRFVGLPHNVFSNTVNLTATGKLWDQLAPKVENYAGDRVPIIHKDAVIREVFQALDRELGEGSDEKGF